MHSFFHSTLQYQSYIRACLLLHLQWGIFTSHSNGYWRPFPSDGVLLPHTGVLGGRIREALHLNQWDNTHARAHARTPLPCQLTPSSAERPAQMRAVSPRIPAACAAPPHAETFLRSSVPPSTGSCDPIRPLQQHRAGDSEPAVRAPHRGANEDSQKSPSRLCAPRRRACFGMDIFRFSRKTTQHRGLWSPREMCEVITSCRCFSPVWFFICFFVHFRYICHTLY